MIFQVVPSPLTYRYGGILRLQIVDPSAPPPTQIYFAPTVRTQKYGKNGKLLPKPKVIERRPGADPGVVAFLDFHYPRGDRDRTLVYIDYTATRDDMRGRKLATHLVDRLIRDHGTSTEYDFGQVMSPAMGKIVRHVEKRGLRVRAFHDYDGATAGAAESVYVESGNRRTGGADVREARVFRIEISSPGGVLTRTYYSERIDAQKIANAYRSKYYRGQRYRVQGPVGTPNPGNLHWYRAPSLRGFYADATDRGRASGYVREPWYASDERVARYEGAINAAKYETARKKARARAASPEARAERIADYQARIESIRTYRSKDAVRARRELQAFIDAERAGEDTSEWTNPSMPLIERPRAKRPRARVGRSSGSKKSAGFVVLNTKTGEVVADDRGAPFKRREGARSALVAVLARAGFLPDASGRYAQQGLPPLGIQQIELYPGEKYEPRYYRR